MPRTPRSGRILVALRRLLPASLPLLLVLAPGPARADPSVAETEHYRLHMDGTGAEATRAVRVLEAAWAGYTTFFGGAPKLAPGERLTVRFARNREAWAAAIRADGGKPPTTAGGYYWPSSRTAYLYRQPTVYFTRTLLLHEAAHQFHYLTRTRNRSPKATWYTEGVAEHLSWHRWDGESLRVAVIPGVTLKDYPAAALTEASAAEFDLGAIVEERKPASRALTWALYSYLATGDDGEPVKGFATFARKMDAGGKAGLLFRRHIGPPRRVQKRFVAWLRESQTPWAPVFNEWEQIGKGRMRGYAGVVSACRLKEKATALRAVLEVPARGRWRGGLLLHWTSATDFTVGLYDGRGRVRVNRRRGNRWQRLHGGTLPRTGEAREHRLAAVRAGDVVRFRIDDRPVGAWSLPGTTLGLALENCDLRFRGVRWD